MRLAVSAAVAFSLLIVAITLGSRFLQGLPAPLPPEEPSSPPPESAETVDAEEPARTLHLSEEIPPPRIDEQDVEALREFLALSPAERLTRALAASDARLLGVNGFAIGVPGIMDPAQAVREGRVLVIPGTTDSPISEDHRALVERSRRYAAAYNALLSRHAARAAAAASDVR